MRGAKSAGFWMINRTEKRNNEEDFPAIIVLPDLVRGVAFCMAESFILILTD